MYWEKVKSEKMNLLVNQKLSENKSFSDNPIFGIPASLLNNRVFPSIDFLKDAPFLRTMLENPNHIGCHTSGESEEFFKGSQSIEREVIRICSEEILKAKKGSCDGYIASGGTEGNIQALWIFRNKLIDKYKIQSEEIAVIFSEDTHYSIYKACNLLSIKELSIPVIQKNRQMDTQVLKTKIKEAKLSGIKHFVAVLNMGTTMFGSVDQIDKFLAALNECQTECMIHIDAAFGGFIYPFSGQNKLNFNYPQIISVSLDGHKMLQAPYGTGVFIVRKPFLKYVSTTKASYVGGHDQTLCGSRSGALAVAMWMIFSSYGSDDWSDFINGLLKKTDRLALGLKKKNISFFQEKGINIITIPSGKISNKLLAKYHWVADNTSSPKFYKAVIMDHVSTEQIDQFLENV